MNAITTRPNTALAMPEDQAIDTLRASLYPGARIESVSMVLAWCRATGRDPMKKPVHIVPMWVKDATTGKGEMRDVIMPGIGTYRTDAARTGEYVGKSEPEFGPDVTGEVGTLRMTSPKWCKVTVSRLVQGIERRFTATEFWLENYATAGKDSANPNAMWKKRAYGQLAKCTEAQALRMAFPDETGNTNTMEEMEGKTFDGVTIDAPPQTLQRAQPSRLASPNVEEIPNFDEPPPSKSPLDKATEWLAPINARLDAVTDQDSYNEVMQTPKLRPGLVAIQRDFPALYAIYEEARAGAMERIVPKHEPQYFEAEQQADEVPA